MSRPKASRLAAHGRRPAMVGRGCLSAAFALLGCSRMPPADAPPPIAAAPVATLEGEQSGSGVEPITGCAASAFDACTEVCSTRACLEWCAGPACVELASSLHACVEPARAEFMAAHPEPELIFLPPGPDVPEEELEDAMYAEVDPDSEDRLMRWQDLRSQTMEEHWSDHCRAPCRKALATDDAAAAPEISICDEGSERAIAWRAFARQPEPPSGRGARKAADRRIAESAGLLGALAAGGMVGALGVGFGGSYLRMHPDAAPDFPHRYALSRLLTRDASFADAQDCVPGLGDEEARFTFEARFGADGRVDALRGTDSGGESECLAELLDAQLQLPVMATRGLPALELELVVRRYEAADLWGSALGAEVGEAYGVGGLGLGEVGTGAGGGGSAEGLGGLGTIGHGGGADASGYGGGAGGTGEGRIRPSPATAAPAREGSKADAAPPKPGGVVSPEPSSASELPPGPR